MTTWSSRRRSTARWATTPTGRATRGAGSSREVENSLRRLQTDWIDLYQIHRPDPDTDIDETLGVLSDLVRQGKVVQHRLLDVPGSQIVEAHWCSERRGHVRFMSEQPPYSMLVRGIETEVLPVCERYGMGVIPWSPLAGGFLSGRYRKGGEQMNSSRVGIVPLRFDMSMPENQRKLDAVEQLRCWPRRRASRSSTWRSRSSSAIPR